jgi:hypothetical protein
MQGRLLKQVEPKTGLQERRLAFTLSVTPEKKEAE